MLSPARLIIVAVGSFYFIFVFAGVAVRLVVVVLVGAPAISGGTNGGFAWLDRLFTAVAWQKKKSEKYSLSSAFYLANSLRALTFFFPTGYQKRRCNRCWGGCRLRILENSWQQFFFP